ncbi:MAG: 30S ribosomal protein S16 [Chloroflexota bacterium]|nr:30S ribosomal protein S16 [Chloroflexota bacterium]
MEHHYVIKLRLRRMGAKKRPHYRIVATEHSSPRDGRFIESIGYYHPIENPPTIKVDLERAKYWISVGAQPSPTVASLIRKAEAAEGEGEATPVEAEADAEPVAVEA